MNWRAIGVVYGKELRDMLRDRRTIISVFVLPTLLIPTIMLGFGFVASKIIKKATRETPAVMIVGGQDSPKVHQALVADRKLQVVPTTADYRQRIVDKKLRAAVEIPAGFDAALAQGVPAKVKIYHYEGELRSNLAAQELEGFLRDYRDKTVLARLTERHLPADLIKPFAFSRENVAPPERVGGNIVGGLIPYIIILLCFTGAMYPALDLTAGEKERGTMETILCSPIGRSELVLGKFLMVLTGSLSTVVLAAVSAAITLPLGAFLIVGGGEKAPAAAGAAKSGAQALFAIDYTGFFASFFMILPVAVLFAAGIFALALFAKTYKEAQSTVSPLIAIVIMPAIAGMLPGVELNTRLALVPLLNVSLACKELVSGVFHWNYLALIFLSTCLYATIALLLAVRMFKREDVIFRT